MEQGNNKLFTIVMIFEVCLILIVLSYIYLSINEMKKLSLIKEDLSLIVNENIEDTSIDEKLEVYENIDEKIKDKYEEYYNNIALLEQKIEKGESDVKIAYLTFDDGPYELTTSVLDVLKNNNVRATFFTLGKTGYDDTYKRIVLEGHTLANHTYYHNISTGLYQSTESFMQQVKKLEEYLYGITGYTTTLVRFPGGSPTAGTFKESIIEQLHNNGYNYVDWTSETGDGSSKKLAQKDAWAWYQDTTKDKNIIVLLMHDYNYQTFNNLQRIIDDLKERGFIFLPLHNKSIMAK